MTSRQLYEGVLIELNKVNAPTLLLEDYNYLANKAIQQYVNKQYGVYDQNQQTTDSLRVLKTTANLQVAEVKEASGRDLFYGPIYQFDLPQDYLHLLNCVCDFAPTQEAVCTNPERHVQYGATRLVSDIVPEIINNYYFKPTYKRPYYYIHNINTGVEEGQNGLSNAPSTQIYGPTNPVQENGRGTDLDASGITLQTETTPAKSDTTKGIPRTIKIVKDGQIQELDAVNRISQVRYGNPTNVRIEIRFGQGVQPYQLDSIYVDYLRAPQYIQLTQDELDLVQDTSQMMEFPDWVCYEIINELVKLILENTSNSRLNTAVAVSTSVPQPAS